jgi:hypothetical protein
MHSAVRGLGVAMLTLRHADLRTHHMRGPILTRLCVSVHPPGENKRADIPHDGFGYSLHDSEADQ